MTIAPPHPNAAATLPRATPYAVTRRRLVAEATLRAELLSSHLHHLACAGPHDRAGDTRRLELLLTELARQIDAILPLTAPARDRPAR